MSKADKGKSSTGRRQTRPASQTTQESRAPDDIVLVHVSDLHFGDTHRFPISDSSQRKALGIRFGRAIKQAATALGASVERALVMVTGDISNAGQPDEFDVAVEVFQGLGGELGIGNHRFVLCPGNHDIDWFESEVAEIQGKQRKFSPARAREDLDLRKLNNYRDFLKKFYGDNVDLTAKPIVRGARRQDYEDLRVSVIGLNACERESHRKEDHLGTVSVEQAQAALDSWRDGPNDDWIRILCVHHNPDRTAPDNLVEIQKWLADQASLDTGSQERIIADIAGLEGREGVRRAAQDARVSLLLHGHQHESDVRSWKWPKGGETLVLAAGSAGADTAHLPGEQPNQIRVIAISPAQRLIRIRTLVWDPRARQSGSATAGDFVPGAGERDDHDGAVYIPPTYIAKRREARTSLVVQVDSRILEFVATYRQRLSHTWADWDLKGMAAVGGVGRPVTAGLDDMYQPLRLGPPDKADDAKVLDAEGLLKAKRSMLIRGPAGAGKTTWMRYTFRQLLKGIHAVPFMLVLRDVAARWSLPSCTGEDRSLDASLRDSVAAKMGAGWNRDVFREALTAKEGPVPVLLVDGWDELGDHGQKLREMLLGFMQEHPRVRVLVSTRP